LINGAGGGSGTYAIQLAKMFGAEVTGVDAAEKLELMRSLGADYVVDYAEEDFTRKEETYDLILDFVGYHSIFDFKRALNKKGRYLMVGASSMAHLFQTLFLGTWFSLTGKKKMGVLGAKPNRDLAYILELIESGKIKIVIDKEYPLSKTPEAFRYLCDGRNKGKVVITLEDNK